MNDDAKTDPPEETPPPETGEGAEKAAIDEEELRARIEEQIRKVRVEDLVLDSAVSILNLAARRITVEDDRDLEQARIGIDAARAVCDLLDEDERTKALRDAISQVQMLYAKEAG